MIEINTLPQKEIKEGFKAQFVHGYWDVVQGAILPAHSHIHEQVTQVLEGQFEMTIGQETKIYKKGQLVIISPNVVHGGKALTDCKLMDVFCPVREDYKV
jgi:quercetin dioxygenase-like cupin family protein